MSHYEYFLIFLAPVFCAYASYTDLKTHKIRNFCSLGLVYVGTLSQLMVCYIGTATPLYLIGLFFGSGLIAFAFYWFGIFSPGDAKLFWGLCLIFPASLFQNLSGALGFTPLILALNIILPYSIGVVGYLLFKFIRVRNKLDLLRYLMKSEFQKDAMLEKLFSLLVFIGIGSALTYLLQHTGGHLDPFLQLGIILVAFTLLQKLIALLPKTLVLYTVVGFLCIWAAIQTTPSVMAFLSSFTFFLAVYFVVFVAAKQLVLGLVSLALERVVDVNGLQVGMVPAEEILKVAQPNGSIRYEKKRVDFSSGHGDHIVISPNPEGLTVEEISQLQSLAAQGAFQEFQNHIRVQPAIRFAPVISLGVVLTILCQGPFYLKLTQFF